MNSDVIVDTAKDLAKAAPPTLVTGGLLAGLNVTSWIQWATLIYLTLMIGWQLFKFWQVFRGKRPENAE